MPPPSTITPTQPPQKISNITFIVVCKRLALLTEIDNSNGRSLKQVLQFYLICHMAHVMSVANRIKSQDELVDNGTAAMHQPQQEVFFICPGLT